MPIPEAVLKTLWAAAGVGALKVRMLINRFRDRSLAALDPQTRLSLHDLQRDFVRKRASDLRPATSGCWTPTGSSARTAGRADRRLAISSGICRMHLAQAGRRDELRDLLLDYAWIKTKLVATDMPSLLGDFAQTSDPETALVGRTLMLSAHVVGGDAKQLPTQLVGRLRERRQCP